jgi:hypothetical protein
MKLSENVWVKPCASNAPRFPAMVFRSFLQAVSVILAESDPTLAPRRSRVFSNPVIRITVPAISLF